MKKTFCRINDLGAFFVVESKYTDATLLARNAMYPTTARPTLAAKRSEPTMAPPRAATSAIFFIMCS